MSDESNVLKLVRSNRCDVDRLADVRDAIKTLQAEESVLRERLLETADGQAFVEGDDFVATIEAKDRRSLGTVEDAQKKLPPHLFNALVRTAKVTYVRIMPKKQEKA